MLFKKARPLPVALLQRTTADVTNYKSCSDFVQLFYFYFYLFYKYITIRIEISSSVEPSTFYLKNHFLGDFSKCYPQFLSL